MSDLDLRPRCRADRRQILIPLCALLGLGVVLAQEAKADFIGNYALSNFQLTNNPSATDGSWSNPDGHGQTLVLTGGDNGTGNFGTTDFVLLTPIPASGLIQFNFSYTSTDPFTSPTPGFGCGLNFAGPCDHGYYLLNGNQTELTCPSSLPCADNQNQGSGQMTIAVTQGQIFGFRVDTDNQGGRGILTISGFTAPVPEPGSTAFLLGLTAVIMVAQRRMARTKKERECRS